MLDDGDQAFSGEPNFSIFRANRRNDGLSFQYPLGVCSGWNDGSELYERLEKCSCAGFARSARAEREHLRSTTLHTRPVLAKTYKQLRVQFVEID